MNKILFFSFFFTFFLVLKPTELNTNHLVTMQCFSTNIWDMVFIVAEQPPPSRQSSQQNASGTTYLTSVARLRAQAL